jgi:uncharacterized protein (DUF885 family)
LAAGDEGTRLGEAKSELELFFEELYESLLRLYPEFATRTGDHRFDHLLSDPGPAGHAVYRKTIEGFLARLAEMEKAGAPHGHRLNFELCRRWLQREAEGFRFNAHLLLLDPLQGFQISLPNLINDMPRARVEDFRRCLERIRQAPRHIEGVQEASREGLRLRVLQARPAVEKVLVQLDAQAAMAPRDHPFFWPFRNFPAGVPPEVQDALREDAHRAIETEVIPALRRLRDFLKAEYLPRARPEAGIWSIPDGPALYAWLSRVLTTTDLAPEEIHRRGRAEVERIRAEMEKARAAAGFSGSLAAFFQHLRTDERFYYQRPDELLTGYRDIAKRADAELPRFFGKLPRIPYGVLPVPEYAAASGTAAYYLPPPADGSRAGYFYANTHDLRSRPRFEMEALSLHESVPGHHLQICLQLELADLPAFRTRWLSFTAFIEGWGLYAELLGKEMGFYTDPYSEFGRLTYEMWRACRLVVDTGIHHLKWTRDQAIEYLLDNSSLSRLNVESEVDRYIVWPGQALAYKIGEMKILELRRRAERELGESFDLREFHDRLLDEGSLPLDLLEEKVTAWIAERKALGFGLY